jgi:LemA protein
MEVKMEDRERIRQMLKEGKINSDQATLLIQALKESEQRKEKMFQQIAGQKNRRERKVYGFLTWWLGLVFVSVCILIFIGSKQWLSRDIHKALNEFYQASVYLEKEDYTPAIEHLNKGIKKAPQFFLGYSLSGLTYRVLLEKTNDQTYQEKSIQALKKAVQLKDDGRRNSTMGTTGLVFLLIFFILIFSVTSIILFILYNILVKREEGANEAWAQAATQYQRKVDLIPALLEAVKNYASHENGTLEAVTHLRSQAQEVMEEMETNVGKIEESQNALDKQLANIRVLAEKYPDLKANINFLTIQQQLEETEDKIAPARQIYNTQVKNYNVSLRLFPFNLMAALFQFPLKDYFKVEPVV